jgi:hypothetical protein
MAAPSPRRVPGPVLVVLMASLVAVVGAWAFVAVGEDGAEAACGDAADVLQLTAPSEIGTIPLDDSQVANADAIVRATMASGRSRQAADLAVATAMQESALLNIAHGDEAGPDSRGLFQQRLQFYGHVDVMDPAAATLAFLEQLDAVPGWTTMRPADAIQSVQRSAHPELYSAWIEPAGGWVDAIWAHAEACP